MVPDTPSLAATMGGKRDLALCGSVARYFFLDTERLRCRTALGSRGVLAVPVVDALDALDMRDVRETRDDSDARDAAEDTRDSRGGSCVVLDLGLRLRSSDCRAPRLASRCLSSIVRDRIGAVASRI